MKTSYSFDDVLITPKLSSIKSRKDISLKTTLSYNKLSPIHLNIPIISSPMDTVTEDKMAISMAMSGGLGIIHRFQSIESQVEMVKNVKRHFSYFIESPYTIHEDSSIQSLINLIDTKNVSSILVIDNSNKFKGIISKKDIDIYMLSQGDLDSPVSLIMTPYSRVHFVREYNYQEIIQIFTEFKIEKIPILDSNNYIKGLVILKNFIYFNTNKNTASLDSNGQLLVGAAVGINNDYLERSQELINAGVDILCIDVANGHNIHVADVIKTLKIKFPNVSIMAGNVCTAGGYEFLCQAGADCIRVGIGNGSICSTRLETGIGMCQFSALLECSKIASQYNVPMISDGGHCGKNGNKFKALAVGSSCVMLGKSLAGTSQSPGNIIFKNGKRFKYYRGMASAYANLSKQERQGGNVNTNFHVEGIEGEIEYKGSVIDVIQRICNGIRSGMSYLGVISINELHKDNVDFTVITTNGFIETKTRL